jgi:predicted small metal-binding protein
MKTMTCQDLGGACDLALRGESADEIIKAQDRHLKDAATGGDAAHESAHREMQGRWKHPKKSLDWYTATKKAFAQLPED